MHMIRKDIISLAVIEKGTGPHAPLMKRELEKRKEALELVDDISSLAEYIGGKSESSGLGDWIIEKEAFPGVVIHIVYEHADEEFPSTLKDFYSGEMLGIVPAEDLSHIEEEIKEMVEEAAAFAERSPWPDKAILTQHVYSDSGGSVHA